MEWFFGVFSGSGLLPPGACGMEGGGGNADTPRRFRGDAACHCRLVSGLWSETCLDGCCLGLVAGFLEQGEHVFLVSLHAGLVEGVHVEEVA